MSDKKIFALTIPKWGMTMAEGNISAVSYTHLTLPTICSV